jgi:SAM-dependent methyltransferase
MEGYLRPNTIEKSSYETSCAQEAFIVPLLKHKIEASVSKYASPSTPESRALDIGCGGQPFRKTLERLGYSYQGMDVNQHPGSKVDFVCAIDEPLPRELIESGPYEFVLCTEVMEHVADWDMAFRNLKLLVQPEGRILITCPHFYQLHEEPYDFWRPTLHALRYFAERSGFRLLHQEAAGDGWDVLGTLLANLQPSSSNKLLHVGTRKFVSFCKTYLFKALSSRRLQRLVKLESPFYLSNVVVLQRCKTHSA